MTLNRDDKLGILGWLGLLFLIGSMVALFCMLGCTDKETIRTIQSALPEIDKPPIECPKNLCRHGNECVKCEDDGR